MEAAQGCRGGELLYRDLFGQICMNIVESALHASFVEAF
jgi:hypothetical protein